MSRKRFFVIMSLLLILAAVSVSNCLAAGVTINRDTYGVPHIYSSTMEGLYYGFGYSVAQDRLFQLEMLKRTCFGRVSEVMGSGFVVWDQYARKSYPTRDSLKKSFDNLDPKYQSLLKAYVDGINAWIEKVMADQTKLLPLEFNNFSFLPEKWDIVDVLATYTVIFAYFMDSDAELENAKFASDMVAKFGAVEAQKYINDMIWSNDPGAVATLKNSTATAAVKGNENQLDLLNKNGIAKAAAVHQTEENLSKNMYTMLGLEPPVKAKTGSMRACSNALVLSPQKSATGEPILMGGPQFGFWIPSALHEVGLHGNGYDIVGSTLAGTPFIMFGHNQSAAFTSTAGAGNIEDIYEEKLNPEDPTQYKYQDKWVKMDLRTEMIKVKGEKTPREFPIYSTVHGVVLLSDPQSGVAYSIKRAYFDNFLNGIVAYYEAMMSETPEQFINAASENNLSLNFFYGDKNGNIAYYHCGNVPVRADGVDVRYPTPGDGTHEWKGMLSVAEHPQGINTQDYFANWNNKPNQSLGNGDLSGIFSWGQWGPDQRAKRIMQIVDSKEKLSVDDVKALVRDIAEYDLQTMDFKPYLMQALATVDDPQIVEAMKYLTQWDNLRRSDAPGYTIWSKWWNLIFPVIFSDKIGEYTQWVSGELCYGAYGGYSVFYRLLQGKDAALPLQGDYLAGRDLQTVFVDTMKQAINDLKVAYNNKPMAEWLTPIPTMALYPYEMVPFPIPSSVGSVNNIPYMDRGSENHIVLLNKKKIVGINVIPAGQNAFISSTKGINRHFEDQLDLYANYQYKPIFLEKSDVVSHLESTEILTYKDKEKDK